MSFLQNLRRHVVNRADSYRWGTVVVAAGLLVGLFALTQPVNLRRHNTLLHDFSRLQSDESRLGEAVLQLSFNLSNNYDEVTSIISRMSATVRELRTGNVTAELRSATEFQQQLRLLDQRITNKQDVLEHFKSRNAVLKNSLLYLPFARDDLVRDLPSNSHVNRLVNALLEQLLLNRVKGGLLERGDVNRIASDLQKESDNLPTDKQQQIHRLIRHAHLIDDYERSLPILVRQLTSTAENTHLAEAYGRYFDHQQRQAAVYRFFLLLAALALLVYAVRAFLRLREQRNRLELTASVFATASEGITITDIRGTVLDINAAFSKLTGYSREEIIGKNPRILSSGRHQAGFYKAMWQAIVDTGHWQGEIWNRRKNGEIYPEWLSIAATSTRNDGKNQPTHYVATFSDITQHKKNEAEIYQLVFFDPLTSLPNRRLLMDRLRQTLSSCSHTSGLAAILFVDIDHFKTLNDVRGNEIGDLLLQEIARRLQSCAREGDTVARLGSDEFVVLLQGLTGESAQMATQVKAAAEKIRKTIHTPYDLKDFEHSCSCSIGISLSSPLVSAEEMLQHANTAMSEAKSAGRNTLRFFDPTMQSSLEARAELEADLRQALVAQQFVLFYQLQVDAEGHAIGAEALVRWKHPQKGLISPATFIPLAEETGLILPLGQLILEIACAQLKVWESQPSTCGLILAINVSARQLSADGFVSQVETALQASGIEPARLKLEITESMLLSGVEKVISTMRQLKALGVSFSMDDFGTGYSSLQYLKRLPLDQIKIDQSFVRDIVAVKSDQAIVGTIIAMAHSLNLSVIAEGVETEAQRETLASKGCTNFQGYLFSQPLPIEDFETLLSQHLPCRQPRSA
jgi:diguanylate cyclase (GGDEF)-like protein/PAS domain S-box-containing protein